LTGAAVSARADDGSSESVAPAMGALALQKQAVRQKRPVAATTSTEPSGGTNNGRSRRPSQSSLFSEESSVARVIPFDHQQRESLLRTARSQRASDSVLHETAGIAAPKRNPLKVPPRKQHAGDPRGEQSTLDFLPTPSVQAARTLKTTVEAVIYCDSPVATPLHRAIAAILDAAMIFIGVGLFIAIFVVGGGPFTWSNENIAVWIAAVGLIAMLYGFIWTLCGRETAGMHWAELRIINFNGFPPDGKSRAVRLIGCWLSYSSGLIGILWALMDEEGLTWHDHMSKTFPTVREKHTTVVRPRR
jgi:uncharacterized RDD family membrane protein YckC